MNKELKIRLIVSAVVCTIAYRSYLKTRKEQRQIRRDIASKLSTDLKAIYIASGVIQERIRTGQYKSPDEALTALKFETIVVADEL